MPPTQAEKAANLRAILARDALVTMPCCFDAHSARLIEQEGFELSFLSGFAVSATRIGLPDMGFLSYGEIVDQARLVASSTSVPIIGDGDTGYGNATTVRRTVDGFRSAGMAGIMIEDQVWPKRCGHVDGKAVVDRQEAFARVAAAVRERDENGDILVMARTDALALHGMDEALHRAREFQKIGADILFVEAPDTEAALAEIPRRVPGIHMANMLEGGATPILPPADLDAMGYRIAAYPVTLLSAATSAMVTALKRLKAGKSATNLMGFPELKRRIGFDAVLDAEAAAIDAISGESEA
ncbi:MAG: isocitrate lyase/PEP mutase family protein [Pseudomonadota bacterium]